MHNMHWKILIILTALLLSVYSLVQHGVRLGKDLEGGLSLIYHVNIPEDANDQEAQQLLSQVIDVLKNRINPQGILDISITAQGRDRIEIVMPLPNKEVEEAKQRFQNKLDEILSEARINPNELRRRLAEHTAVETWGGQSGTEQYDRMQELQEAYDAEQGFLQRYKESVQQGADQETIDNLEAELAAASVRFELLEDAVLAMSLSEADLRRMVSLSTEPRETYDPETKRKIIDPETNEPKLEPSLREIELASMKERYRHIADELDQLVLLYEDWQSKRRGFDDVEDLKRLLRGAGVLEFRIAVTTGEAEGFNPDQLRQDLDEHGPDYVSSTVARWFKINDLKQWYDDERQLAALEENPVSFFARLRGLEAARYGGDYYLLLYDTPDKKLTHEPGEGPWTLTAARPQTDNLGRPAVGFELDGPGGRKMRILTGANLQKPMAIVLDGEVYSAPIIQSQIGSSGQITGSFSQADIQYLIRVLASGSLDVRLDEEPIAQNILGPSIGRDNLARGLRAGIVGLILVAVVMAAYYFFAGMVANFAVLMNAIIILGIMAMQQAAFTLPGIAGVILTIGTAVDANIIIYERIREEMFAGETDLRAAIRLGYQKAFSAIVDANVTNLIVCVVLYRFATTEVKGFALTLGIGILATLFTALFVTRVIYTLYTDLFKAQKLPMLATVVPAIHRLLEPNINWVGLRKFCIPLSVCAIIASLALVWNRGVDMFDTEFRGGVSATFVTRPANEGEGAEGARVSRSGRIMLERRDVERRVRSIGEEHPADPLLSNFAQASVLAAGGEQVGGYSDSFQVKVAAETTDASDTDRIIQALVSEFRRDELITNTPPHAFTHDDAEAPPPGVTFDIPENERFLGQVIARPSDHRIAEYAGGVAIVIDNLAPPARLDDVTERIERMRQQDKYRGAAGRQFEVIGLERAVDEPGWMSMAIVVNDDQYDYLQDPELWQTWVAQLEWSLVRESMSEPAQLEQVATYSSSVADTLVAGAVVAVTLSLIGILGYIWIRFGSFRYSFAAVLALIHDAIIAVGLLAMTHLIAGTWFANLLGIEEFRIDLGVVAAILTVIGYSLNDTIVILDRVRENRGKVPLASARIVNLSINQTFSRTILTSFTTLIAMAAMYAAGGTGIRPMTFVLLIGMFVGTYSTVAIAAPLVYRKTDSDSPRSADIVKQGESE